MREGEDMEHGQEWFGNIGNLVIPHIPSVTKVPVHSSVQHRSGLNLWRGTNLGAAVK